MLDNNTLVSVCMTTFYHEDYISQAIESVLAQKVSFKYEIVVSDDCSKDKTPNILQEYASKYDFIKININENNIGLTANSHLAYCMCKGKYVVMLSGDDYYIDENKLQKQFDYLESHADFFGVCTFIEERYDNDSYPTRIYPKRRYANKVVELKDFLKGCNYPLNGIMVRNAWLTDDDKKRMAIMPKASRFIDDITLSIMYLELGKIYILKDSCTAYRILRNTNGKHNFNSLNKGLSSYIKHIENLNNLDSYLDSSVDLFYRYKFVVSSGFYYAILGKKIKEFNDIYRTIPRKYKKRWLLIRSLLYAFIMAPKKLIKNLKK